MPHYIHPALRTQAGHAITVDLIGCGGTGSALLTHLARLHLSLRAQNQLGLHVRVFDDDTVSPANLVRQHFQVHDVGRNKAEVAVERLNRFYGLDWQALPTRWDRHWVKRPLGHFAGANLLISCVDTVSARRELYNAARAKWVEPGYHQLFEEDGSLRSGQARSTAGIPLYWLDTGNGRDIGQVLLSTFGELPQPKSYGERGQRLDNKKKGKMPVLRRLHPGDEVEKVVGEHWQGQLPTIFDLFPDLHELEEADNTPSCSLVEALGKQSLMVNPMIATAAANLLAQLFEQRQLTHHGCFINLQTFTSSPIAVQAPVRRKLQAA